MGRDRLLQVKWIISLERTTRRYHRTKLGGIQEICIRLKGGYHSEAILVKVSKRLRLDLSHQKTPSCTEMALLPDFNERQIVDGQTTPIEFALERPGEHEFACQIGMVWSKFMLARDDTMMYMSQRTKGE